MIVTGRAGVFVVATRHREVHQEHKAKQQRVHRVAVKHDADNIEKIVEATTLLKKWFGFPRVGCFCLSRV